MDFKLVMVTKREMEIGRIYRGLEEGPWIHRQSLPDLCYKVVALATENDWIDCLVGFQGEEEREWLEMVAKINGPWRYYEFQTD